MADRARAVFLDRDGTVIEDARYPRDPAQVRLLPGAAEALKRLSKAGFALVVVSNQSGIGRGLVTPMEAAAVHQRLSDVLTARGVQIDGAFYCPHAPAEGCSCRKPSPELVRRAAAELGIDLGRSFLVGDKASDVEAGQRAGCVTVLLSPKADPAASTSADAVVPTWEAVRDYILGSDRQ